MLHDVFISYLGDDGKHKYHLIFKKLPTHLAAACMLAETLISDFNLKIVSESIPYRNKYFQFNYRVCNTCEEYRGHDWVGVMFLYEVKMILITITKIMEFMGENYGEFYVSSISGIRSPRMNIDEKGKFNIR